MSSTFRAAAMAVVLTTAIAGAAPAVELWMNCGGPAVTVGSIDYAVDSAYNPGGFGYVGGQSWINTSISDVGGANTNEYLLFRTGRRGYQAYRADVPNGDYIVTLGFNETEYHGPGFRAFDVIVEGDTLLTDLDLAGLVGPWYSVRYRWAATLTDGTFDVETSPSLGLGDLSLIGLSTAEPDTVRPPLPGGLVARGSYGRVLLSWSPVSTADLAGYNVYRVPFGGGDPELLNPQLVRARRYLDDDVIIGQGTEYRVTAVDVWGNESLPAIAAAAAIPVDSSDLKLLSLTISEQDLYTLNTNVFNDFYVPAVFQIDGTVISAEARYRGSLARLAPKKSFKVRLPFLYNARDRFNINAEFPDAWLVRNKLGFDLFEGYTPVPRVDWIHLRLNDQFAGVYSEVENYDEHYLTRVGLDPNSALYKATGLGGSLYQLASPELYITTYEKKTGPPGHDDIIEFVEFLNLSTPTGFADSVAMYVDVDAFVDYYTVIIGSSRIGFVSNNYYLYHDLNDGLWRLLPWDNSSIFGDPGLPLDLGTSESPTFEGPNRLVDMMMDLPAVRYAHGQRLLRFLDDRLNLDVISPLVNGYHDTLLFDAERDFWKYRRESISTFNQMVPFFENFVTERGAFIQAQVDAHMPALDGALYVNELMPDNQATLADEAGDFDPWIELYNHSIVTLNLDQMYLSTDLGTPTMWALPDTTLPPGGFMVVWADNEEPEGPLHANFTLSPGGGAVYLFDVVENGNAVIDSLVFGALGADSAFGRFPDGGTPGELATATPGASNVPMPNAAPVVSAVDWSPKIPGASEPVVVTCTVSDDHTIESVDLWLLEPGGGATSTPMADDGTSGDGGAGDGVYGATIPGEPDGALVRFYIEATDDSSATTLTPPAAPADYFAYKVGYEPPPLALNEVLASNLSTNQDEGGDYADWFEIHNGGTLPLNLGGMFVTDDLAMPRRWELPDTTLAPGGFLLIWADNEPNEGPTHATFKLDADGEELGLFDTADNAWARIDTVVWGPQTSDISYGRDPDGAGTWRFIDPPTPGYTNVPTHLPPVISDVAWNPDPPGAGQSVAVVCRVTDDSGVDLVHLWRDAGTGFASTAMFDDGAHADGGAGDGIYGVTLAGTPSGTRVRFYVEAIDDSASTSFEPDAAPADYFAYLVDYVPPPLYLNEFMASNVSAFADEFGQFDDWIEIYNGGTAPIALGDKYLSDDLTRRRQWAFPDTTIPAGAFFIVWADRDTLQGPMHANFALEKNGEEIGIFDSITNAWSRIDSVSFGSQLPDVSLGRDADGGPYWIPYTEPTPGASNLSLIAVGGSPVPAAPRWSLGRAFPNPVRNATNIPFSLAADARIELDVYNVRGALVRRLVDGTFSRGEYEIHWDGHDLRGERAANGIYFLELRVRGADGQLRRQSARIVMLR